MNFFQFGRTLPRCETRVIHEIIVCFELLGPVGTRRTYPIYHDSFCESYPRMFAEIYAANQDNVGLESDNGLSSTSPSRDLRGIRRIPINRRAFIIFLKLLISVSGEVVSVYSPETWIRRERLGADIGENGEFTAAFAVTSGDISSLSESERFSVENTIAIGCSKG